ncbi:MAG: DEAD/DEAH box helicase family protein [Synergistaceae bacterium]|jgi:superfamily II DNA or RNA helicase|nr:DEAD/DEAH box helicase family protein [Synergistaceae bacterium]
MEQSTFTWANFDTDFLLAVLNSGKAPAECKPSLNSDDPNILATGLNLYYPKPTPDFVKLFKPEIGQYFFGKYSSKLREVLETGEDSKDTETACLLDQFARQPMTADRVNKVVAALLGVGSGVDELPPRFSQRPDPVNLRDSSVNDFPLFTFQREAVSALQKAFLQGDRKSGLLVMPTGSGKTMTTAYFLLRYMIPAGYQVVWLAHRHLLLDQAAGAFYDNCPLIKLTDPTRERFQLVCVSGEHESIKSVERDDDVILLSVQSVFRNLEYLKPVLRDKLVIVVDEAHHTIAKTYLETIRFIQGRNENAKLLGLTATPIKGHINKDNKDSVPNKETAYLQKIFTWPPIYDISIGTLTANGTLAKPQVEHVETGENFESSITPYEARQMAQLYNIPESLAKKIADSKKRNALIVEHYMKNRDRYKKTLIFALNTVHARTLHEDLVNRGVRCGCVYSDNPKNACIIKKFTNNELDVLVNINIMTEGSDVPDIQTVMLTRPTGSDVLLMQMIGRSLRGTAVGGTKIATIVDFHDHWDRYNYWINPEWLVGPEVPEPDKRSGTRREPPELYPWLDVRTAYDSISSQCGQFDSFVAMPYGWYSLVNDGEDYTLLVFEDQVEGYERLIADAPSPSPSPSPYSFQGLAEKYFGGFCLKPSEKDLKIFLDNLRSEDPPALFLFGDRDEVDPWRVAKKILEENLNVMTYPAELYARYPVIENLFGNLENYRDRVFYIMNHKGQPLGCTVVSLETERLPFVIDGAYDVKQLMGEVIDELFTGRNPDIRSIRWTDRPYRSYYGMFYPAKAEDGRFVGDVAINLLLNSSQVPREVVKYVIYHELLHRDYPRHDPKFREMEHKYPNYVEWERFLDYRLPRFYDFPYWDDSNRVAVEQVRSAVESQVGR